VKEKKGREGWKGKGRGGKGTGGEEREKAGRKEKKNREVEGSGGEGSNEPPCPNLGSAAVPHSITSIGHRAEPGFLVLV